MENIYIDSHYDESFLIQEGHNIRSITIPKGVYSYNINSILLSYSPNVEEFIIEDKDSFEFSEGVLYSKIRDYRNIEYITKTVKCLKIDADVTRVSYWHGVDDVIVDSENTAFSVVENMLLSKNMKELYFVFDNAEEVIIPEGVVKIHYRAFEYCEKLKRMEFPETYSWDGWYKPHFEPLWILNKKVVKPEIIAKGSQISIKNEIVFKYKSPKYYFGDCKCCHIPNNIRDAFNFDDLFKFVESFSVSDDHPTFSDVNGILLDKTGKKLLFYPRPRKRFNVPESVSTICSFAVSRCNNLEEAIIPENIKKIERNAFTDCKKLDSVVFSSANTDVDPTAFSGCVLTKGDYKVGMDEGVFYNGRTVTGIDCRYSGELKVREGTRSIKKIVGPARPGVVEFGATEVNAETLAIPASVTEIDLLFVPLKSIIVDDSNTEFCSIDGVLFSKDARTLIRYPERHSGEQYTVPESVESIADYAFYNCQNLKSVTIHGNVKRIGENAFCYTKLDEIEMPAQPIKIGELALLVNVYLKYGGKSEFANTIIKFRHEELLIPLKLIDNWGMNKEEVMLSQFIETNDVDRKKALYSEMKTSEYKKFMALYLSIVHDDSECRKYLSRIKNKLIEDSNYSRILEYLGLNQETQQKSKASQKQELTVTTTYAVGDTILFGHFELENKEVPLEWIVVDSTKKQYLLLSNYLVREMPFYSGDRKKKEYIGWSRSDVRAWLNGEFFSAAFNDNEKDRICLKKIKNINDADTEDHLFIPNEKEFMKYVETPDLMEKTLQYVYGTNRALGNTEMLRKTWLKYSECCIEVRTSQIWVVNNKPSYNRQSGRTESPYWIRPMMWILK